MSEGYEQRLAGLPRTELGDGRVLVTATTHGAKRRGLSRLDSMSDQYALRIPACLSVHTFGMRFPLDLIWLGRDGAIVRVDRDVPRGRMRACLRARSVIETRAGEADAFVAAGVADSAQLA